MLQIPPFAFKNDDEERKAWPTLIEIFSGSMRIADRQEPPGLRTVMEEPRDMGRVRPLL